MVHRRWGSYFFSCVINKTQQPMPQQFNSDLTEKLLKLIAGGVELDEAERVAAIKALKKLKVAIEKGEDEAPLLLVENCREAGFASLPSRFMGILDKMLGQGSTKYLLGDAKKTFAYDSGQREFVQCVPYKTLELARELDQKKINKSHDIVGRLLRVLVNFEKQWKKVMHQSNSMTVPLTKNDEYTDKDGKVVMVTGYPVKSDAGATKGEVALNRCEAATTSEECDARLDGPYGDPGACLWMPYYQHLEGPTKESLPADADVSAAKGNWATLQKSACVPKDTVPFPMRKMDETDESALLSGKTRLSKKGAYDKKLKMMRPSGSVVADNGRLDDHGNVIDEMYTLENIKNTFLRTSALLPNGRDIPYFENYNPTKFKQLFSGTPDVKQQMVNTIARFYSSKMASSENTPQRVKNKMDRARSRHEEVANRELRGLEPAVLLEQVKVNSETGNYKWEDEIMTTKKYPDFIPIQELYARSVYELAKAGELTPDDIRKIVERGSAERGRKSVIQTSAGSDGCTPLVSVKNWPAKAQPIQVVDTSGTKPVFTSDKTLGELIKKDASKEEMFVVLRGGGDLREYDYNLLQAGGTGAIKQNLGILGDNVKRMPNDVDNHSADQNTCLHEVDIGVVMVLKGNFDKYKDMVESAFVKMGQDATGDRDKQELLAAVSKLKGTTPGHKELNYLYLTLVHPEIKNQRDMPENFGDVGTYNTFVKNSAMYRLLRGVERYADREALGVEFDKYDGGKDNLTYVAKKVDEIVPMVYVKQMINGECTGDGCDTIPGTTLNDAEKEHIGFVKDMSAFNAETIMYKDTDTKAMATPDRAQILYWKTRGFDLHTDKKQPPEDGRVNNILGYTPEDKVPPLYKKGEGQNKENDKEKIDDYLTYDNIHYTSDNHISVGLGRPKERPSQFGCVGSKFCGKQPAMRSGAMTLKQLDQVIMKGEVTGILEDQKTSFKKTIRILEKLQAHISGKCCDDLDITKFGWVRQ